MKRRNFSLIELLLVIAIIAILAGLSFAVLPAINRKGKETKARSEINAIKLAFQQFETDYGTFPQIKPINTDVEDSGLLIKSNPTTPDPGDLKLITRFDKNDATEKKAEGVVTTFFEVLTMTWATGSKKGKRFDHASNPNKKGVRYLDPPTKSVKDKFGVEGFFKLDPWDRYYNIALDWNYDGKLDNSSSNSFGGEEEPLLGKIFIFSYGADGAKNSKNYITSWKTSK